MKYIVYCTTCLENGKIYIGVHKTEDPDIFDGYIGCGLTCVPKHPKTAFHYAVKKYGYKKFKRATLFVYDKIDDAEELLVSAKAKKRSLLADKITGDNIYKALVFFDKLYAQMNEAEKREFLSQLVDNVQIYEERKENGQWLKSIEFKLPIIEKEFTLSLDNDTQNETVVLLSKVER